MASYWRLLLGLPIFLFIWRRKFIYLAMAIGLALISFHQYTLGHNYLSRHLGEELSVSVQVSSDWKLVAPKIKGVIHKAAQVSFLANTITVDGHGMRLPVRVLLSGITKGYPISTEIAFSALAIQTSERRQTATLFGRAPITLVKAGNWLQASTSQIRGDATKIASGLGGDGASLIPGLVLGDTSIESANFANSMKRAGLTHLTAVSGENFAIVATFLFWVFDYLLPWLVRTRRARIILIALALGLFIVLVRPSPSVLRAAVMSGLLLIAKWRGNRINPVGALGAAILLLIVLDPYQAGDPGFALSVAATGGILLLLPRLPKWLPTGLAASIAATLFCLPIIFAISGQFSLVAILANSLVEPAVAPVTVVGFIAAIAAPISPGIAKLLMIFTLPFAGEIAWVANHLAKLPVLILPAHFFGAGLALFAILLLAKIRFRAAKVLLSLILLVATFLYFVQQSSWPGRDWRLINCDVGQGDGALLNLGNHSAVVIDAGPDPALMQKCLDGLGITSVPLLILTHFHADHVGGVSGAMAGRKIGQVWITNYNQPLFDYEATMHLLGSYHPIIVHQGERASIGSIFGNISIQVVWPTNEISNFVDLPGDGSSINNQSIALFIAEPGFTYFTGGDIEPPAQSAIVAAGLARPVLAFKVSHHGSAYQDMALLDRLAPQVAVISVGAGNTYGHPAPSTIAALAARHIRTFRTDQDGAIALAVAGSKVVVRLVSKGWFRWG